ncbi:DUF3558 domain-containing protein [Lentzea sp. NBRC 102530]|uniref:DUF3558 domain-containing protein n=1 Tax=Lentzea sp. NBRC 102530 TaxID=3032201 RepID=UPI0024A3A7FC|nr:DUF3558 domain-containing protein [Lentzea sp. NBRC 102530]GLY49025.1 hypothetical protein Lesp01_26810 [Lentzea sp. NBRC 102530]
MTALLTAVLAFGALAGCTSSQTGGNPTPAPTTGGEQTSTEPTSSDPGLSIAKYVSAPCSILTSSQTTTLGSVRAPAPGTGELGPLCEWKGQDVIKNSRYTVSVTEKKPFDDMVANVKNNPVFDDKKIDGVRVVSTDQLDGLITCLVSIQASKTDSVTVQVNLAADEQATKKACPEAERVAQLIITNLKG